MPSENVGSTINQQLWTGSDEIFTVYTRQRGTGTYRLNSQQGTVSIEMYVR